MGVVGTGIVITFASGFIAELLETTGPGLQRASIDMSHHGTTGGKPFSPGKLYDPGELQCSIAFDPGAAPPILNAREPVTIAWPDSAASEWAGEGFMTGFTPRGPLEDRMTADVVIKLSGSVDFGA